jgi:hypothetical protein
MTRHARRPHRGRALVLASALCAITTPALAHRSYNATGFAGTLDPLFTLSGQDGFGLPSPTHVGGSGPNSTTAGQSFYQGGLPVSWMTAMHESANTAGEVFTLSTADARAGSASTPANFVLGAGGSSFGTQFDFGAIRVDHPQVANGHGIRVTVSADAALGSQLKPYVALYSGWDASWQGADGTVKNTTAVSTANRQAAYVAGDHALGSDLIFVTEARNEAGLDSVTLFFTAAALEGIASAHFTLMIGGVNGTAGAYTATVETAVVPVPGAALLFGSALAALGLQRRRRVSNHD